MSMDTLTLDVVGFIKACSQEPSDKNISLYMNLVREECGVELEQAMADWAAAQTEAELQQARADAGDAICDSIWVLIGLAYQMNIPVDQMWDEVVITNWRKVDAELGLVRRDENGKVMKPPGWRAPDMLKIIQNFDNQQKEMNRGLPDGVEAA
jgi:predicted HAD superfamily Cof-like phosphohydrolase